MLIKIQATIDDLYHVPDKGKAEIINGEVVLMSPTGGLPGYAGGEIFASLRVYAKRKRRGFAFPDNVGFLVNLPHRRSVSPDAAYYLGEITGGEFLPNAPIFAVEVRRDGDYGANAEKEMANKRADYFACGTQVVWDVDVLRAQEVRVYRVSSPDQPIIYHRGDKAEAEPAVPGWRLAVDDLFP